MSRQSKGSEADAIRSAVAEATNDAAPFTDADKAAKANGYDPLPSVWFGDDSELLDKMLRFYPRKKPKKILDATVNTGRFWRGLSWDVTGLDVNPEHNPTVVGDNTDMPFDDVSFDVVVYDPPHIPNQGKDKSKDFNTPIRPDVEVLEGGWLQLFLHVSAVCRRGVPCASTGRDTAL